MNLQQNEIIQHAMSSENNLRIAIQVASSFHSLKMKLMHEFTAEFKIALYGTRWDEIDISEWENNPFGKWTKIQCRSRGWPEFIFVCIEAHDNGYVIAVRSEPGKINETLRNLIAEQLKKNVAAGEHDEYCCWRRYLDERYRYYDSDEMLLVIFEKKKMSKYLVEQLNRVGECIDAALLAYQR